MERHALFPVYKNRLIRAEYDLLQGEIVVTLLEDTDKNLQMVVSVLKNNSKVFAGRRWRICSSGGETLARITEDKEFIYERKHN